MRMIAALNADIRFQFKQGFYLVYVLITIVYMVIINCLPENLSGIIIPVIVFADPATIGFFFIGGMVMLEKEQGILQYLSVTPLRSKEYLLSKILSLGLIGSAAAVVITLLTSDSIVHWGALVIGVLLSSIFFTLYGFLATVKCKTINEYFIRMIPYLLFIILPCFSLISFKNSMIFNIFPGVDGLKLIFEAFNPKLSNNSIFYIFYLAVADVLMFLFVDRIFNNKILEVE
ncbi:MAG: hypothetical protein PQJ46_00875 [Spirochaetales bacterium]|nr:hypothetical protein [Spirochaetales bacterium]